MKEQLKVALSILTGRKRSWMELSEEEKVIIGISDDNKTYIEKQIQMLVFAEDTIINAITNESI